MNDGGAPVNLEDNDRATPLHTAAQAGQTEVIQKLVSKVFIQKFERCTQWAIRIDFKKLESVPAERPESAIL